MPDYLVELEDGRKFRVKSKTPLSEEEVTSYALGQQTPAAAPAADQPGRLGSFASNVGRGALSVIPGTVGGVGYALGSDTLTGAADTIEGGINRMLPVNPEYQDELLMKGGQAVGQAIGMLGTGGAVGAAGKSLALSRGLAQGAAAAKGANLAKNVMLGTGIAQGTRGGGQAAEQYGMQGGAAYARALLGGAIEGASERYLFGMGTELAPVKKFLGEAAEKGVGGIVKSAGTEAGEEAVSQIGGNVATSVLAPYGVQTPGVLEGVGESALLGGIAGGTIGGIGALMQPSPTIEGDALVPTEQAPPPVEEPEDDYGVAAFQQQMTEIAAQPDPIEPLQQTVTAAAENSVRVNANVLPATAAVIEAGGLAPAPTVEQPAPVVEQPAPIVDQPRTREEEIAQMRARLRLNLSAEEREDMEQQLAQAQDEGVLADVFAEERRKAAQRDDFLRRQQDLENERQRLADEGILGDVFAEERQRATAREQQRQQPPVVEETVAPIQPVPVVEETGAPVETKGKKSKTKPKTVEQAQARIAEQQAASEFVSELRAEKAQEELRNKKGKFISDNAADNKESTFLSDLLKGGWDKSLDDVQAGRVTPQRAATLAQAAADAGLIDTFTAKRFTPEQVPNVENVIDEPGAAEVGSGMEVPPKVGNTGAIPTAEESARWDAVNAYTTPIVKSKTDEDLDALGFALGVKRQGLGDSAYQDKILANTHPDDLLDALNPPAVEAPAPAPTVQRDVTKPEIPAELKAKGIVNIVGGSKDAKTFDKWLADQGVSDSQINPENGDGGAGYLYLDRGTEKAGQFSWSSKSRTGVDSRLVFKLPDGRNVVWLIETQSIYEVDPTKIDPNPYFKEETAFEKPPEQMSPDEAWADEQAVMGKAASKEDTRMVHEMDVNTALGKNKPVSAAAVDAYKITLPEGYVRQGDLYVFQPSGTVGAVADEAETYTQFRNRIERENAEEFQGLTASEKSDILDDFADLGQWGEALVKRAETEQLSDDVLDDYVDRFGLDTYAIRFRGKAEQRQYVPKVVRQQPGKESLDVRTRGQKAADTRKAREKAPAKPKNMAGEVRPERAKPTPAPEFTTIHPKTQEKFNTAFEAKDAGAMNSLLDPMNKGSRAEFERRTGVKLPTTQKGTRDSVETWAATTPVADLTDTELDRDLLRLGEYSKKTYASDALKARALELAKEFQKRQDVVATKPAETELAQVGDEVTWMAAGREARGTVYAVRGDSADIDYFGPKTVPLSELSIVRKSGRRLAQEKRDAEAAASTAQKKPQEPKQPKPKSKFTKAEVASLEQGKTPEGWILSVGEPVTVTDTKGKTWRVKTQYSPTRTMTLVSGDEVQTFDVQTAPQPKPAAEVETPVAGVPAETSEKSYEQALSDYQIAQQNVTRLETKKQDAKIGSGKKAAAALPSVLADIERELKKAKITMEAAKKTWMSATRAPVGGEEHNLSGKFYKGGQFMPEQDVLASTKTKAKKAIEKFEVFTSPEIVQFEEGGEYVVRITAQPSGKKVPVLRTKDVEEAKAALAVASNMLNVRLGLPELALPVKMKDFGSTNTVVTKEAKDQAAKSLRESLGQTNVGLNPATLKYAITVGTYYLEGGARSFADFSAKMVEEFGEGVRKYLQPAYEALRKRTDIDTTGMDSVEGVETAPVAEAPTAPAAAPAARVEAETPKAAPTQAAPKPATESFPTEIKLTEQPERPQASVVPPDNKPVGFSNAEMDAEAARIVGRELVRPVQEAISDDALWAQATAEFKRDSDSGRRLVTSLVATPRVVSSKEQAMLGMELVRRKNVLNAAATKFLASPEGDVGAKSEYETAQRDYDDALYANSIAGSDIGRALRFRRLTANMDMELESMLSNLKAVGNKADITKEQVTEASKIAKEYEANAKAVDALRKQAESTEADRLAEAEKVAFEAGRQAVLKDIEERAKADAAKVAEMQKRKAEHLAKKKEAEKKPSVLDDFEKSIEQRIASRRGKLYSDVLLLNAAADAADYVLLGAVKIAKGITKLGDWVASMRGSGIELNDDEMQQLFKESKAFDAGEDLPASETPLKVKKAKAPAIDKVKAIAADEEALDSRTVYNLVVEKMKARVEANPALKKVEMSADDLTNIISEVTEDVQEFFPGITEREIRNLFSGYGIILKPSKDDLAKQIRQLSALGKLQSAIEDAEAKRAPLKSGPQRDKATQAIRLQQKKLARELRMMGRDYEAGEEQLRSPLDAIKARLNNQIDDLAMEINTRKKAPRRPSVDYDKDTQELADLRDELKRISDFINAPAGPTFAELVQDEKDKLDKRIGVLEKALESKQFMPKEDKKLYTQELQVKRDKRDELNEQIRKLRKIEADKSRTQEDIDRAAIASVKESIAELDRKIKEKDFARPERRTPTETAEYLALVAKKEALQDTIKEERLKLFGRKGLTDEQRVKQATAAVDKSIERMQKMLTSGNYDVPKRTSKTPETPELAQKRETRDKLRKQLLELRKLKRDALIDPIAKQLKTDKKRIQTRMDKLKKRMETGDFSKPVKREKPTDPELLELLAKEEKLKERWGEMLLNHKLSQRSRAKRYWDNVFDLFSMGRFLKASTDLSAIANQGNFALFSHPVLSMRQLGGMWKAMQSDTNQKIINAKIRELPEYKSGEMKRAGLYLSLDAGPNDPLQRQEEAMASRWVDKIPKRYGGGILRATSRAYTTYLDLIRVATYLSLKNNLVEGGWFMQPQETTPERLQSVANLINNGTGRGSLGSGRFGAGMSQAAPFLNTFLFAPRFGVSRFAMALGIPLWTASKGTKVLIAKEYTKYLAGLTTAMILYSMFQDEDDKEMEFDPTSSDFGKVLFDNQRVDVMGGFQQPLVFLLRLLFGEYKNSKGLIKPLREGDRPLNLFRETPLTDKPKFTDRSGAVVVGDFLRYKLSPTASLLLNTIQGKTPVGERTDLMSEVITMPVPLIIDQMYETAKAQQDDPFMAALLMGSGVVGVRTSNQDPKEDRSKAKTAWEQLIDYTKYYSGVK